MQFVSSGGGGFGPTTAVDATRNGTLVFDSVNNQFKICNATTWVVVGSGSTAPFEAGSIVAFQSTTCPSGWSEYTPARGRFLRGIDNGAGIDPGGTRAPGNQQAEAYLSHNHTLNTYTSQAEAPGYGINTYAGFPNRVMVSGTAATGYSTSSAGSETRPDNVAVLFCEKN